MERTLIWVIFFIGFICMLEASESYSNERPPEAVLPTDRLKPKVELSLLRPENPHEGDDVQLECSAKPKDRTNRTRPDSVHWIKGNVGVPEPGRGKEGADRFVREVTENDKGTVLFLLTIRDAEPSDADKYMCIVQVGETGYFTSNEVQLDIQPADSNREKVTVEISENDGDTQNIRDESRRDLLTQDERDILRRKDELADMSEDELMLLSKAMKKDKEIKKKREEEEKQEEQERLERIRREAEQKRKPKLELTQEEDDILKRKGDLADMSPEELQVLQQAMKKERDIEAQRKEEEEEETKLTKEEIDILKRKDEIRDMTQDQLKLMAGAVTKQKKIQEERRKKYGVYDEDVKDIPEKQNIVIKEEDKPFTAQEVNMLTRKHDIVDLSTDELVLLSMAMKKQKVLEENNPNLGDDMSNSEMFKALDSKGEIIGMSQEELDTFMTAWVKQKKMRSGGKVNDPLEDEEEPTKRNKLSDEL